MFSKWPANNSRNHKLHRVFLPNYTYYAHACPLTGYLTPSRDTPGRVWEPDHLISEGLLSLLAFPHTWSYQRHLRRRMRGEGGKRTEEEEERHKLPNAHMLDMRTHTRPHARPHARHTYRHTIVYSSPFYRQGSRDLVKSHVPKMTDSGAKVETCALEWKCVNVLGVVTCVGSCLSQWSHKARIIIPIL